MSKRGGAGDYALLMSNEKVIRRPSVPVGHPPIKRFIGLKNKRRPTTLILQVQVCCLVRLKGSEISISQPEHQPRLSECKFSTLELTDSEDQAEALVTNVAMALRADIDVENEGGKRGYKTSWLSWQRLHDLYQRLIFRRQV